jgi:hypothetical protein
MGLAFWGFFFGKFNTLWRIVIQYSVVPREDVCGMTERRNDDLPEDDGEFRRLRDVGLRRATG